MSKLEIDSSEVREMLALQEDIVALYPHTDSIKYAKRTIDILKKILGFEVKIDYV